MTVRLYTGIVGFYRFFKGVFQDVTQTLPQTVQCRMVVNLSVGIFDGNAQSIAHAKPTKPFIYAKNFI